MTHPLPFDEDMDQIWVDSCSLAESHHRATNCPSGTRVTPWHLALQLLFGGVSKEHDHRLRTDQPVVSATPALELPLFWTALSRVCVVPEHLSAHLADAVGRAEKGGRLVQQLVGQAIWKKVEAASEVAEPPTHQGDEEDPILGYATERTQDVLTRARALSQDYGGSYVAPQHVLLALLAEDEDDGLKQVLKRWPSLKVDALFEVVRKLRPMRASEHGRPPMFPQLNEWATDLTQMIIEKKKNKELIDPLIGRSVELRRLIAILSKFKKNSAVLLGDPGVGKTAIAEGLAHRIVNLQVPESVVARVFSLDLTSILASTQCKLAYEQIITDILNEVAEHEMRGTRAILFFDNLSEVTVGGYQADGSGLDAASIMKRFFAQGTLRCVGCSTVEDYRDHIEKDGALARRFSPVSICETTPDEATEVLRGLKDSLERFHNVRITDAAFKAASSMATQYFSHKRLPDAALDLVDEACVSVSLTRFRSSEEVWKMQRKRVVMGIEIRSLERQLDEENERRLEDMRYKLSRLDEKIQDSTSLRRYCQRLRQDIRDNEERRKAKTSEMKKGGKVTQARLMDEVHVLDAQKQDLKNLLAAAESGQMAESEIHDEAEKLHDADPVTVREVAITASYYTFVPAAKEAGASDVATLDATLSGVVVRQKDAIDVVSGVMQSLWAGLKNPRRPVASILFGGPAGSGKTLLVKELAKFAARQSGKLITIHASDYAMPHNMTRLVGTPVCTGCDSGGQLTECVKRKPFSVVYIKEIEQGCTEFQMFIQTILDEGIAKDGDGHVVNFTNCIIVLTTALGRENLPRSAKGQDQQRNHYEREINRHLPGEFLARVDHTVIFNSVEGETLLAIIDARIEELRKQLATIDLKLIVTDEASGYIPVMLVQEGLRSARSIERWFRRQVIMPLTTLLLSKETVPENAAVVLYFDEDAEELAVDLKEGAVSVPSSPASSYYSLNPEGEEMYSDMEGSDSDDSDAFRATFEQPNVASAGRPALQLQTQRVF